MFSPFTKTLEHHGLIASFFKEINKTYSSNYNDMDPINQLFITRVPPTLKQAKPLKPTIWIFVC
jgi:hypothetical protein